MDKNMVLALVDGIVGYVLLLALGLVTKILPKDLARNLANYIVPMMFFLMGCCLILGLSELYEYFTRRNIA